MKKKTDAELGAEQPANEPPSKVRNSKKKSKTQLLASAAALDTAIKAAPSALVPSSFRAETANDDIGGKEQSSDNPQSLSFTEVDPPNNITLVERWKFYLDERTPLINAWMSVEQSIDKVMVTLPATAIALSITVLWNIKNEVHKMWMLKNCWYFCAGALLLALAQMWCSQQSFRSAVDFCDNEYRAELLGQSIEGHVNRWNSFTSWLQGAAIICFMIGLTLLMNFATHNVPSEVISMPANNDNKRPLGETKAPKPAVKPTQIVKPKPSPPPEPTKPK